MITGKLLQWLEANDEWESVHTIEEIREELKHELWIILFGRHCQSPSERNVSSASFSGGFFGGQSGSSDPTSATSSAACESMKKEVEQYLAEWIGKLEESVEHLLKHKYARDYDHLNWSYANAIYVMWTAITTIGTAGCVLVEILMLFNFDFNL